MLFQLASVAIIQNEICHMKLGCSWQTECEKQEKLEHSVIGLVAFGNNRQPAKVVKFEVLTRKLHNGSAFLYHRKRCGFESRFASKFSPSPRLPNPSKPPQGGFFILTVEKSSARQYIPQCQSGLKMTICSSLN